MTKTVAVFTPVFRVRFYLNRCHGHAASPSRYVTQRRVRNRHSPNLITKVPFEAGGDIAVDKGGKKSSNLAVKKSHFGT